MRGWNVLAESVTCEGPGILSSSCLHEKQWLIFMSVASGRRKQFVQLQEDKVVESITPEIIGRHMLTMQLNL